MDKLILTAIMAHALGGDPRAAMTVAPIPIPAHVIALPEMLPQGGAADSLWRAGKYAIADEEWDKAADIFARVRSRFPRSPYVGDSFYWQAYALYQKGGTSAQRQAVTLLDRQIDEFASAKTIGEARALRTRIRGVQASAGDEDAAAAIAKIATDAATIGLNAAARALNELGSGSASSPSRGGRASTQSARCRDDDDDERVMALNALLQMNSDDALPLLKEVLKRREPCSEILRRKAVFLVSQKRSSEAADILMDLIKNDPDREVREQAIFWLGSAGGERAVTLLESVLKSSNDVEMQKKAVFSLQNSGRPRAYEVLRDYATRDDINNDVRMDAIFWLGQRRSEENATFLRQLFARAKNREVQDKIIFSLAQQNSPGNAQFLMDRALDQSLDMEVRKSALFWAANQGLADVSQLSALYDRTNDVELKEHVIFVLQNQKGRNSAAIDKLIDIAKNDKNREMRGKAIFWLGQSRDPRVIKLLQDIILRPPDGE